MTRRKSSSASARRICVEKNGGVVDEAVDAPLLLFGALDEGAAALRAGGVEGEHSDALDFGHAVGLAHAATTQAPRFCNSRAVARPASQRIPIALLPGMDGTGELLDALASRLSLSRPVHIISYPLDEPLGYAELTGFAAARLPEGRFAILGESFSGPVAIEIAASEPRAAGLILASSFAWHPLPSLLAPFARRLDLRWMPSKIVEATLLNSVATQALRAHLREELRETAA